MPRARYWCRPIGRRAAELGAAQELAPLQALTRLPWPACGRSCGRRSSSCRRRACCRYPALRVCRRLPMPPGPRLPRSAAGMACSPSLGWQPWSCSSGKGWLRRWPMPTCSASGRASAAARPPQPGSCQAAAPARRLPQGRLQPQERPRTPRPAGPCSSGAASALSAQRQVAIARGLGLQRRGVRAAVRGWQCSAESRRQQPLQCRRTAGQCCCPGCPQRWVWKSLSLQ